MRMYEPSTAAETEQKLAHGRIALLKDGSGYANIFTGGAEESHFCPASLGWGPVLRAANPCPKHTFFSRFPTACIDHIFLVAGIDVLQVEVASNARARVASDHLLLIAEVKICTTCEDTMFANEVNETSTIR
jgi:hypothetical protein